MYEYTLYEGGPWYKATFMDESEEDIITNLKLCRLPQTGTFQARTLYGGMRIYAVKFPDGRIWDAFLNNFRPIHEG